RFGSAQRPGCGPLHRDAVALRPLSKRMPAPDRVDLIAVALRPLSKRIPAPDRVRPAHDGHTLIISRFDSAQGPGRGSRSVLPAALLHHTRPELFRDRLAAKRFAFVEIPARFGAAA